MRTLRERLLSRLIIDPDTDCLLWTGARINTGYGEITVDGRTKLVHRVMYELFAGPIPDGLTLDHVRAWGCRHRHCANVAHLEPVTYRENNLRGNTITAACAAKTHCINGHEFTEANTYRRRRNNGWHRECRTCKRARQNAARKAA